MNEVKSINLSRSKFVIAQDAYKQLSDYLDAIKKHADNEEVVNEIEARMAELLIENRSITENKVVLKEDVAFLKIQLGTPADFEEHAVEKHDRKAADLATSKRKLMRDPENQIVGGVASGLGVYFDADPLWFRLIFIALSFGSGFGIFLYIVMWVLLPEAKTESDKLEMHGLPVTVENIKERVENLNIGEKTSLATHQFSNGLATVLRAAVKLFGVVVLLSSVFLMLATLTATNYVLFSDFQTNGVRVFPVTATEKVGLGFASISVILFFVMISIVALKIIRRKQIVSNRSANWLGVLFVVFLSLGISMIGATAPKISDRYETSIKVEQRTLPKFSKLGEVKGTTELTGRLLSRDGTVPEEYFDSIKITVHRNVDLAKIKTEVVNEKLNIDASETDSEANCEAICLNPIPKISLN